MPLSHSVRLPLAIAIILAATAGCLADTNPAVSADPSPTYAGSFLAGRSADLDHDFNAAVSFYRDAVAASPSDQALRQRLLILSIADGQLPAAFDLAAKMAVSDPSNPAARLALAVEDIAQGKNDDALAMLDHVGNGDLATLTSALAGAWIDYGQGKVDVALSRIATLRGPDWYPVFTDLHTAFINDAAGHTDAAVAAIRKAYGDDRSALRVVVAYAQIMARAGHKDEAIAAITALGGDNPVHPQLRYLLADIKAGKPLPPLVTNAGAGVAETLYGLGAAIGTEQGAELPAAYLRLAAYLAPSDWLITMSLGDVFAAIDRCGDAMAFYKQVPTTDHLRRNADLQIGLCLEQLEQGSAATPYFTRVLTANPDDLEAAIDLGNNYRVQKRFSEAAAIYTRALKLAGNPVDVPSNDALAATLTPPPAAAPDSAADDSTAAAASDQSGDGEVDEDAGGDAAVADQPTQPPDQEVAAKPPTSPQWRLFYYRGVAYQQSNDWTAAEADLKRALALYPDQSSVLNYLGYSWVDRGENLDLALKLIQKAVRLKPTDGFIVDSLGWAYFKLGRYDDAVKTMETAVQLAGGDATINDHLGDVYWAVGRKREAVFQWTYARDSSPDKDLLPKILEKLKHGLPAQPISGSNDHTSIEKSENLWIGTLGSYASLAGPSHRFFDRSTAGHTG